MTYDDLQSLAAIFPLIASKITDTVYSLRFLGARIPATPTRSYRAVDRDGARVIEPRLIRVENGARGSSAFRAT